MFLNKLDQITMNKLEGTEAVVFGGRDIVKQQYCGTVGGRSSDFATINSVVKSTKLKGHPLSPPDLLTNSVVGVMWRLGFGIVDNPTAIWNDVIKAVF